MTVRLLSASVTLICCALVLTHLSGCGVILLGGAAAGTVGYVSGDLKASLKGDYSQVVEAADQAIAENSIRTITRDAIGSTVTYELRTPQDDKIALTIIRASKDLTEVTIRVGVFGDEPLSHQILKEIETRIK